ncbi:DNA recombination protein RmuC [Candidatus Wolfebacteria bacterium]|uniref:DNA recombination protein RmuC n=1 Tax=Candidatus Wolfebacteria bacterium CG_4_10_14_0_2_um_filter_39_18 TaxID=1975061 RepID=A0A2M7TGH7_9BACT|nr:DNA recombination protein RmuC [Candidatus Wolfebacteria bacterium]NCO44745.1 DNA recombination protein RmuC [Candidatus Wolfebacteria bacterium]PIZ45126.1 MAG: DNA recombination protein RmuC [Candidatus Wolfebacteria bacterium CG_4_10_14_0_2_um_filter_39_18]
METVFLIIIVLVLAGGLSLIFWLLKKNLAKKDDSQSLLMLQNQINEVNRTLDNKLGESTQMLQRQFGESARIIKEITTELTKVGEGQRRVVDIAKQLENLQDILKNPKQRGVLGEYYLKTVLENVLAPGQFEMQYPFKDGTIVDAVIFIKDQIVPVDSKFSLENYNRLLETKDPVEKQRFESAFRDDLKARIDETAKYIKPKEGTMEFAFMFIPSEAVYYDLLVNKIGAVKSNTRDLIEYAAGEKKVLIVSPTTFLAYLQTVLQGLKALQIEESAKEIRKRVIELGRHIGSFENYMKKLGTHLGTSVNMYNTAYKELGKIDKDVLKISGKAIDIEPITLDKPKDEEEEE